MTRYVTRVVARATVVVVSLLGVAEGRAGADASASAVETLKDYCATCHDDDQKRGGLSLENLDPSDTMGHRDLWESVVRKLRGGLMPPAGMPRPSFAALDDLRHAIAESLDRRATGKVLVPWTRVHRLNGHEYANAIRDLTGVLVSPTVLPPDNSTAGFDSVAESLNSSPSLIEAYVSAAANVSRLAVGDPQASRTTTVYRSCGDLTQTEQLPEMPVGTRGGMSFQHTFPADAEYELRTSMLGLQFGPPFGSTARGEEVELLIDDQRVAITSLRPVTTHYVSRVGKTPEPYEPSFRSWITAGTHTITIDFIKTSMAGGDDLVQHGRASTAYIPFGIQYGHTTVPHLTGVSIDGPMRAAKTARPPTAAEIFVCEPERQADEASCATRIVSRFARRAFRRSVRSDELVELMRLYEDGRKAHDFIGGIRLAIQRVLADPRFTYRAESQPGNSAPGTRYRLSDVDLAARLSFALWSSIPDDALLDAAERETLHRADVFRAQVSRLLADPRAEALVSNFAGQWLYLRELQSRSPTPVRFRDFNDNLRQGYARETEQLFQYIIDHDRSVLELFDADYTFANGTVAKLYGIPGVYGSDFRRVTLPSAERRGFLGHGSFLTITSTATRTAPVLRGAWILENVLGSPPPSPPPSVPNLPEAPDVRLDGGVIPTVRARMEAHRTKQQCMSCHKIMDPIGLALEKFDAIGMERELDAGQPIDPSGQMTDGSSLNGSESLRMALLRYPEAIVETMIEKLMTYAVGRPMGLDDMPAVRKIRMGAQQHHYSFSSVLMGVLTSEQFRTRTAGRAP